MKPAPRCTIHFLFLSVFLNELNPDLSGLTLHVIVRFSTGDPLPSLEAPVVRVGQNHLHEHVVMSREVKSSDVETEEREHSPGGRKTLFF